MLDATTPQAVATQQHDSAASLATARMPCGGIGAACADSAGGQGARRWCVAHTEPGAERWANDNLARSGYATYLPMIAVQRRDRVVRSLTHMVTIPLFTRYLFVANDNPALWRPIRETPGVASVISSNGRAHHVAQGAVEALQALEHTRRVLAARGPVRAVGDAVAVRYGIVAGHRGVIASIHRDRGGDHSRDTARVSLLFLGELRDVELPLDALGPVATE